MRTKVVTADVVTGLTAPWSLAFLPNVKNDLVILFTKKDGRVFRWDKKQGIRQIFSVPNVRFWTEGERFGYTGLLDIGIDPRFERNRFVYLAFTECGKPHGNGELAACTGEGRGWSHIALLRAELSPSQEQLVNDRVIFRTAPDANERTLPGGRVAFLQDGTLLLTVGYREFEPTTYSDPWKADPQVMSSHLGKIVRLTTDGKAPADNPFGAGSPVFSLGHRDPQGLLVDPRTGDIWSHEHGPEGGDEVNLVRAGKNYGFPVASHGLQYKNGGEHRKLPGSEQEDVCCESPRFVWNPYKEDGGILNAGYAIAPSGFALNTRDVYPNWRGHFFVGAMMRGEAGTDGDNKRGGSLRRLRSCAGKLEQREVLLEDASPDGMRVRDVRLHSDGYLYVARHPYHDRNATGVIQRLIPIK